MQPLSNKTKKHRQTQTHLPTEQVLSTLSKDIKLLLAIIWPRMFLNFFNNTNSRCEVFSKLFLFEILYNLQALNTISCFVKGFLKMLETTFMWSHFLHTWTILVLHCWLQTSICIYYRFFYYMQHRFLLVDSSRVKTLIWWFYSNLTQCYDNTTTV